MIASKTIARLSLYRRAMHELLAEGRDYVYSHEIASLCGLTAAQVRRDLMSTGFTGSPNKGYSVGGLLQSIGRLLDDPEEERVALVGVGNMGRAILAYFTGRRPNLSIVAAFDQDPTQVKRVIHGCRCHPMEELEGVVRERGVKVAILAVPAKAAQAIAEQLVSAGVRGILNFAPISLRLPPEVYVEYLDVAISLERVAYFARHGAGRRKPERTGQWRAWT
ncbi:MAG TPA: redox-sensing transcriptional repressor Rex [Candidatus Methylomirabilis sp.]|nr:redox-sensing transcriptional repressor Rex [Candidatus Methylomirabilis sp.]